MSELIVLESVTVFAGGHESILDVDLSLPEGLSTVIMGPSGCGKSTLLKVAAGLMQPDRGRVRLRGEDLAGLSDREMLSFRRANGFVFQDAALWENKTIFENLALPLQVHFPDLSRAEVEHRVARSLERGGLADSPSLRPAQLSAGERKIASFLRAAIVEPTVLFLDEPTASIDHTMTDRILAMMREHKARGCTIVAVAHDARIATTIADRLVVLDGGRVLAAGPFDEIKRSPEGRVRAILAQVIGEIASFDTDLLALLDGERS